MRKLIKVIVVLLVLVSLYLLFWPVPIEPIAWTPPEAPGLTGPYAENNLLSEAKLYPLAGGYGPEDTAIGPDGLVYTGLDDGSIIRFSPDDGSTIETITNTGGRPLGLEFDDNRLYIADAIKGLIYIEEATAKTGHQITVAVDEFEGKKMIFVDDLAIATDGTVWFTDASTRFDLHNNITDYFESLPTGRLFASCIPGNS
jgi:sugar lactone lactonase YvrE